ncbi:MAG: elongation factor G [Clostridiales bacterium]|nr:elongation factor G [Clostridiales bacterium]
MKSYTSDKIRNVAILGHGSCGKTTFLEAALFATEVINRLGRVEDGNTTSDYDKMEIEKGYSINTTLVPVEYSGLKINFLDTPGFVDFAGEVNSAMRAAGSAIMMVDASAGIQVGTEKAWQACEQYSMPKFFVINKTDKDNVNIEELTGALREKFGIAVVNLKDKEAVDEAIAETDEELLEKYFDVGEFTEEEFKTGLKNGITRGEIVPVLTCSAITGEGVTEVLDAIVKYEPAATEHGTYKAIDDDGNEVEMRCSDEGPTNLFVFKTIADPFLGKISYAKVITGRLKPGTELYNPRSLKAEKLGSMFFVRGKNKFDAPEVHAGDIVALAKLQNTKTGDTLCEKAHQITFPTINFPAPNYFIAIETADSNEEEKMAQGMHKLMEGDPTFVLQRNAETHQSLLGGQGDIQITVIRAKLKEMYGVEVTVVPQKIAYRETIKGNSDVQGKHKKQSGGAGQYGDVHIRFSPSEEEFEFTEKLFGGSIPKNYVPAVEKGIIESMGKGPLAGCKVVNIKAELYDGSYHDVDSNEMAFKIAASIAFKKGIVEGNPCLLEPIMSLEILVPEEYTGSVMGDMNKRRGKILKMEPYEGGTRLMAEAPQSELFDYAIVLRAMTQARGAFNMEFSKYEEVPGNVAEKIIADYTAERE